MMEIDFITHYVDSCLEEGITKPADICQKVLAEIKDIDQKLEEYQTLRTSRANLVLVLKSFGHEDGAVYRRRIRPIKTVPEGELPPIEEEEEWMTLCVNICQTLQKTGRPMSVRELLDTLNYDPSNMDEFFTVVKLAFTSGYLNRLEDKTLVVGPNWKS